MGPADRDRPVVEGTMNVLKHYGVIDGPLSRTGRDSASSSATIPASPVSEPFESARLPGCWRRSGDRLRLYPLALLYRRQNAGCAPV